MPNLQPLVTILAGFTIGLTIMDQAASSQPPVLALVGGTVYVSPAEEPIRDGVVLIENGKIAAVGRKSAVKIPAGARTIDCSGRTITAGFWNSHVHFFERKWTNVETIPASELGRQLQEMLTCYGFTSVFDLGSLWANTHKLRERIASGEVAGPRIRSTGEGIIPPGTGPSDTVLAMMGSMKVPVAEVADAAQATEAVRKRIEEGADAIKIFASGPRGPALDPATIQAAVEVAHRAGKLVFVHPNTAADVQTAVNGGVDIIAHTTPRTGPWEPSLIESMKAHHVDLTPTVWLWTYFARHDRLSAQDHTTETSVGQLRAWSTAGGTVLFGTDIGAVDYDPSQEYSLMARAGMSFPQILASLTTAPAARFGDSDRLGRIAPGFAADLVVLGGDPATDLRALTRVEYTLRDGQIIYQADGHATHN